MGNAESYFRMYRFQTPRTLEDLDDLLARRDILRRQLGAEKSAAIENAPDKFVNHEEFRLSQAKAFRRAAIVGPLAVLLPLYYVHGQNLHRYIAANRLLVGGLIGAAFVTSFQAIRIKKGFSEEEWREHQYALMLKFTRNAIVKG